MTVRKGLYKHYKGPLYRVIEVARHSETDESLVVYQALYGDKGVWVRPLQMFIETITVDGQRLPRFERLDTQTGVLEVAILNVIPQQVQEFERAFAQAESIITSMQGYISHSLSRCVESDSRYLLLVNWQRLEDHTVGFRQSDEYQTWRALLHKFYDPFPRVEHYYDIELEYTEPVIS